MTALDPRELIVKRVARELKDGHVVNLGIGLPTQVAKHLPEDVRIVLQSENGFVGLGNPPASGEEDMDVVNAGRPVSSTPAARSSTRPCHLPSSVAGM